MLHIIYGLINCWKTLFIYRDIQQAGPSNLPEQSEAERKPADEVQQLSPNALKVAAADCLNSWIFYLQVRFNFKNYKNM